MMGFEIILEKMMKGIIATNRSIIELLIILFSVLELLLHLEYSSSSSP
jgi:hypothetical protein